MQQRGVHGEHPGVHLEDPPDALSAAVARSVSTGDDADEARVLPAGLSTASTTRSRHAVAVEIGHGDRAALVLVEVPAGHLLPGPPAIGWAAPAVEAPAHAVEGVVLADGRVDDEDEQLGNPSPSRSPQRVPPRRSPKANQSGTDTHGLQPLAVPSGPSAAVRYRPAFCPTGLSTTSSTSSSEPSPSTSATAQSAPWFSQNGQSGTVCHGPQPPVGYRRRRAPGRRGPGRCSARPARRRRRGRGPAAAAVEVGQRDPAAGVLPERPVRHRLPRTPPAGHRTVDEPATDPVAARVLPGRCIDHEDEEVGAPVARGDRPRRPRHRRCP